MLVDSPRDSRLITLVRVPPDAINGGAGPCDGRRCDHCRDREYGRPRYDRERMQPPPPAPPPVDESSDEVWPPTKPGHDF